MGSRTACRRMPLGNLASTWERCRQPSPHAAGQALHNRRTAASSGIAISKCASDHRRRPPTSERAVHEHVRDPVSGDQRLQAPSPAGSVRGPDHLDDGRLRQHQPSARRRRSPTYRRGVPTLLHGRRRTRSTKAQGPSFGTSASRPHRRAPAAIGADDRAPRPLEACVESALGSDRRDPTDYGLFDVGPKTTGGWAAHENDLERRRQTVLRCAAQLPPRSIGTTMKPVAARRAFRVGSS